MNYFKFALIIFAFASSLSLLHLLSFVPKDATPPPGEGPKKIYLDICATGFIKGRLEPKTKFYSQGRKRALGGMSFLTGKVKDLIESSRAKGHEVLLVDLGSHLSGSVIAQETKGSVVVEMLNHLPYQASLATNFEFSFGPAELAKRAAEARFPYVASNLTIQDTELAKRVVPEVVVQQGPVKVGILGLVPERLKEISSKDATAGVEVSRGLEEVARRATELKDKQKVDFVILLTKLAIDDPDPAVVKAISSTKIDLVLGIDYDHEGDDLLQWGSAVATGIPGHNHGSRVKMVELTIDPTTRKIENKEAYVEAVIADDQKPDPAVEERLVQLRKQHPALLEKIGTVLTQLPHRWMGESLMANVVTDAMRAAAGTELAYVNSGGVQSGLEPGEITLDDVFEVLPWENQLMAVDLTGEELANTISQGVPQQFIYHPSGFKFVVRQDAAEKVLGVDVTINGAPIDPKKTYTIAVSDFSVQRVPELKGKPARKVGKLRDALVSYLKTHSPIKAVKEQRDIYQVVQ